ncbi:MAG: DUF4418 family protein [Clostridia bacterium]|nr:DUF4418 family protein [Clostridia bacterium]
MKQFSFSACVILLLALVIAIGSVSFLGPCVHEDGSFGACHWAGQGMLGIGILLAAQSLLALVSKQPRTKMGVYLALVSTALLGIFVPGTLISLCRMATMRCRAIMQPAMTILCVVTAAVSIAEYFTERKKAK